MESINIGSAPNASDGDSLRAAFTKVNGNFEGAISIVELQEIAAASTDFADFQARIAAL